MTKWAVLVIEPAGIDRAGRSVVFEEVSRGTFVDRAQAEVLATLIRQLSGNPPVRVVPERSDR